MGTDGHGPDPHEARRRYDEMAPGYDRRVGFQASRLGRYQEGLRKRAVAALELRPGRTVLDVGCGTGASLGRLVTAVGSTGRVVGIDQSAGMLEVARRRIDDKGWENVELVESRVETATLPDADAALFFFTHDLLRTPAAVDTVLRAVRPGGRVVVAGAKRPSLWLLPLAVTAHLVMRRYITTTDGIATPWDLVAARLDDVTVDALFAGCIYIASGSRDRSPDR